MPGAQLLPRLQRGRQQHGVDSRGEGYRVIPIVTSLTEVLGIVRAVVAGLGLQGVVHWLTCWEVLLVLILLLLILLLLILMLLLLLLLLLILLMMVWHVVVLLLLLLWHVVLILLWVGLQLSVGTHLSVTS